MNTSTVYIEPVFIGFLIGTTIALPFYPLLPDQACIYSQMSDWTKGTVALATVGAAYFVGIAADRLLDSLFGIFEQHWRIRYLIDLPADKRAEGPDPFPEDRFRALIFLEGNKANEWLLYLRTRLRLMRALTFVMPGLVFALIASRAPENSWAPATVLPATWGIMALLSIVLPRWEEDPSKKKIALPSRKLPWRGRWKPPRTDAPLKIKEYVAFRKDRPELGLFLDMLLQPFTVGAIILIGATFALSVSIVVSMQLPLSVSMHAPLIGLLASGVSAVLTLAAAFAWWRMSKTFMTYVRLFGTRLTEDR